MSKKYIKPIEEFEECPNCGSDYGYYQSHYVSGKIQMSKDFNGNPNCSEVYDYLKWSRESKFFFCCQCDYRLARVTAKDAQTNVIN